MTKNQAKLLQKLADFVAECEQLYDLRIVYGNTIKIKHVKRLRKKLYALKEAEQVVFVHGIGKRKLRFKKVLRLWKIIWSGLKNIITRYIYVENATAIPRQTTMPHLCG